MILIENKQKGMILLIFGILLILGCFELYRTEGCLIIICIGTGFWASIALYFLAILSFILGISLWHGGTMDDDYLSGEKVDKLLADNHDFSFKGNFSGGYFFFVFLVLIFGIVMTFAFDQRSTFLSFGMLFYILGELIIVFMVYYKVSQTLVLSPNSIKLMRGKSNKFEFNSKDIYDLEFYTLTTFVNGIPMTKEKKIKIVTNDGIIKKITVQYWKTPRPLPTDVLIKRIISYYYKK